MSIKNLDMIVEGIREEADVAKVRSDAVRSGLLLEVLEKGYDEMLHRLRMLDPEVNWRKLVYQHLELESCDETHRNCYLKCNFGWIHYEGRKDFLEPGFDPFTTGITKDIEFFLPINHTFIKFYCYVERTWTEEEEQLLRSLNIMRDVEYQPRRSNAYTVVSCNV